MTNNWIAFVILAAMALICAGLLIYAACVVSGRCSREEEHGGEPHR
ncbi:MAG: hypothetical protein V1755_05270 [Chloroflexota bacterium]